MELSGPVTVLLILTVNRYVEVVPNGHTILQDKVSRLFPKDDSDAQQPGAVVSVWCGDRSVLLKTDQCVVCRAKFVV